MQEKKPIIEIDSPILHIKCAEEFLQLSPAEKLYSYHFYTAAWEGAKICYFQRSFESPGLFLLLQLSFQQSLSTLKSSALNNGVSSDDFQRILAYAAGVFLNCGNYKSFGDTKFVPEVSEEVFQRFFTSSKAYEIHKALMDDIYKSINKQIFDFSGLYKKIGFPNEDGFSGYYTSNMKKFEVQKLSKFFQIMNLSELNTRIIKIEENEFLLLIASVNLKPSQVHVFEEMKIRIIYGDFSAFLRRSVSALTKALPFTSNLNQKNMLKAYIEHFLTGDMEKHKESQRFWVKDIGPIVETNLGFIETYLDPLQIRAEYEGFIAVVNKKLSERVGNLVDNAEKLLQKSPWPKEFEKDKFLKPDFTSLAVLAFASSGVPLGINIPNYDDIRQEEGFKNVYLANCLPKLKKINFLSEIDAALILKNFEVNSLQKVTYHELLGHGCGKLFQETENGLNFDINTVINPLTGGKITSYYKSNETWYQKFGILSNPYEECRADSIALYYSSIKEACDIMTPEHSNDFDEVCYTSWLGFVHSGVTSLEFYVPEAEKWGQAHCKGRFVILRVLLEAGKGFVEIKKTKKDGKDWLELSVDRSKIFEVGFPAMKNFLTKMMVYKSTADLENASKMFEGYAKVDESFLEVRRIVVENKQPRRVELQGHLASDAKGEVKYESFDESFEGIIESYMRRYPYFDQEMWELWKEYREFYKN